MDKIVIFDTAESSRNVGDYIINQSIEKEMKNILNGKYITKYATHTPIISFYQTNKDNPHTKYCNEAKYKFIQGTNLISINLLKRYNTWNINFYNYKPYTNSILIGCGLNPNSKKINLYTKAIYKKILSKDFIHSVRDEKTKKFIENLGFKAVNTGCPTLWSLDENHCKKIPNKKSDSVVFTLTDYCRDEIQDAKMIKILEKNYKEIYFWVQGANDFDYFKSICKNKKIIIVDPNLQSLQELFKKGNIDYVGTRLHAGIFAMQNFVRSIIIIVDNRARDIKESYNINTIERNKIDDLDTLINSDFKTRINIDKSLINKWKSQFK